MMAKPTVSVIIPFKNARRTIVECVQSVSMQTLESIEILLCEDRSTDGTKEHLLSKHSDDRIKWLNAEGTGACAARNAGFRYSSGKYIQYLDADDCMAIDKLSLQVQQIESCLMADQTASYSALVVFKNGNRPDQGERRYLEPKHFENPMHLLCELLLSDNYIQTGQWLIPRFLASKVGPWNESLVADQDGDFFARVMQKARNVVACPSATAYYRQAIEGQISSRTGASHFQSRLAAFETKISLLRECVGQEMLKAIVAEQCQRIATRSYPRSKSASKRAVQIMEQHDCQFAPAFPTKRLAMIAKIFGWRFARWCSFIKHAGRG